MTTDFEQELRELFREKAGETPLSTLRAPAAAPPQVLRRGRRRQIGTVLGSLAVVAVLVVGSVAGLQRLLADQEPLPTGAYDVFERTATVEAFTITSPSDWYLVNQWPLSMLIAVEGTGSSGFECQAVPAGSGEDPECIDTVGEETSTPLPVPHGLPMLQLTNVDLGLEKSACRDSIPNTGAALYIAFDAERAVAGIADPSIPPFPPGVGLPPEGDGPCGPGRYAHFTVNGEPFFAWVGLGPAVSDQHRETVETAYERMSAIPDWTPEAPDHATPGYVIAGGSDDDGVDWRLEARPGSDVELTLIHGGSNQVDFSLGGENVAWCCTLKSDVTAADVVLYGALHRAATGVAFEPRDGDDPVPGTVVPPPPTLGLDFDLFFLHGAEGLVGDVVAVGLGTGEAVSPAPSPATAGPRGDEVELSGTYEGHEWRVVFTGAFMGPGSPCWEVTVDGQPGHVCPDPVHSTIARASPYLVGSQRPGLYLLAGSVPPEVTRLRFVGDDDAIVPQRFRCTMGPRGWTDPDRRVCAIALPPVGSGTLEYVDVEGNVLFEEGMGWGSEVPQEVPTPTSPVHGGTYWAVYLWAGASGDQRADEVSTFLAEEFRIEAFPGELGCDQGAAEALGRSDRDLAIGVYFETEEEANAFARDVALDAYEGIAQVTTYCLD